MHVEAADALAVVIKFSWEKLALTGLAMSRAAQVLASSSKSRSLGEGFCTLFTLKSCLVHVEAADALAVVSRFLMEKLALAGFAMTRAAQVLASSSKSRSLGEGFSTLFALKSCLVHVEAADALAVVLKFLWQKLALAGLAMSRAAQVLASLSKSRSLGEGFCMLFALKSCLVHVEAADALAVVIKFSRKKFALTGLAMSRAA